jgi:hypothetical protein
MFCSVDLLGELRLELLWAFDLSVLQNGGSHLSVDLHQLLERKKRLALVDFRIGYLQ